MRDPEQWDVIVLYLAGAWTFPAAGFQGAMTSGRHAADLVCRDAGVGIPAEAAAS